MKLIGVTDDRHSVDELLLKLQQTAPFFDAFILREKSKTDEQLVDLVLRLTDSQFPLDKLIIHARPEVANKLSIKKTQLTGYGMSVADAQVAFPSLKFGCSVHSLEEALQAEADGASWLLYGHVYATRSKEGLAPRGTGELFEIASTCTIPVYAIGGIQPEHLTTLEKCGVAGAAILSPLSHPNAVDEVKKYSRNGEIFNGKDD
ncbi:thiamine phosphate synthase [Sporosarcina sp. GW1-11]|uniref:thiamine phosphate synthase n=1 Tax=Sporosarcina sp. GW1-11 TaxID=2899126 RepID=UPI00294BD485|nr:thiamine phosphate synthase [Sporosarcina sp. GW1-11]MDV6379082.1 thiamine phosphate synthase [Sporosarcina sp. GW1-11]